MSETIQRELMIAATPHAIFQALTRPDELVQWFVEFADIQLSEGRYDFWGQLTPGAPVLEQGHHRLLAWETDHSLAFNWLVKGETTSVVLTLESQGPEGQSTRLRVVHEGIPTRKAGEASFDDFWELSLENLRGWVERRVVGARCDFSREYTGDVRLDIAIAASPDAVFQALMIPEELNRYFATNAAVEPYVGGCYDFGWDGGGPVKILELVPSEKLSYSWEYAPEPATVVTWSLERSRGGTHLVFVHSGFGPEQLTEEYHAGWLNCLNQLKFLVEVGPTWRRSNVPVPQSVA